MTSITGTQGAPAVHPAAEFEKRVIGRLTWRLVPFLFLLYIVAYLDRINVGFAAQQMQRQLGLGDAVYGLGAGIFFAGYFFFQMPSTLMVARVGARRWIATLMLLWGTISSATALVHDAHSFYAARFLLGAAEAGFFPGVILYLKGWFPESARARTVARFMAAGALSGVIGGPLSGALLGTHLGAGLASWQWMFVAEGVPAVLLGVVVWHYLVDKPEAARWLPDDERSWLLEKLHSERLAEDATAAANSRVGTWSALRSRSIWLLALLYFGLNTASYGMSMWLPRIVSSTSGLSSFAVGALTAIPYLAAVVAMVLVAHHSDHTGERRWHVAAPAFAGAVALAAAVHVTSVWPQVALLSVTVLGVFAMVGPFWAMSSSLLPDSSAAAGIALINAVGNLGGFAGPYLIGLARQFSGDFRGGLHWVAAGLALSGLLALPAARAHKSNLHLQS